MIDNIRALYQSMGIYGNCEAAVMFKLSANPDPDMLQDLSDAGFAFSPATTYRFCIDPEIGTSPQMQFTRENIYGGEGGNIRAPSAESAYRLEPMAAHKQAEAVVLVYTVRASCPDQPL